MKIYKIVLSSGDPISIYEEEITSIVESIHRGDKIVITKRGIFNPSFYVEIVLDRKAMEDMREDEKYQRKYSLPEHFDLEGIKKLATMKSQSSFGKGIAGSPSHG